MSWQGALGAGAREGTTKVAGLEVVKTETVKGKGEREVRLQMGKGQH